MKAQHRFINAANKLSDHALQLNLKARVVSQNLQGPYAIKRNHKRQWVFDLPSQKNYTSAELSALTGMDETSCIDLQAAMKDDKIDDFFYSQRYEGVGEGLGQGGYRLSIETNIKYDWRMNKQLLYLADSISEGADVLCLQEQPYDLSHDLKRKEIFHQNMQQHGYKQVANLLGRDVGIWVKQSIASQFKPIEDKHLKHLIESAPFRGCSVQNNCYLYINVHMDRHQNQDDQIRELIELKEKAYQYARKQYPGLQVAIHGDFNLFRLSQENQNRLIKAGYQIEPVKGQEKDDEPNCEAYLSSHLVHLYYSYQMSDRWHLFKAKVSQRSQFNHKHLSGDKLKTAILTDLAAEIENIIDLDTLEGFKRELLQRKEYQILAKGQGLLTRLFQLKTSSLLALEKIIAIRTSFLIENKDNIISNTNTNDKRLSDSF